MRFLWILAILGVLPGAIPAQPIPPTRLTGNLTKDVSGLFAELEKQTTVKILPGIVDPKIIVEGLKNPTVWESLETVAKQSGTRLVVNGANRTITFAKGAAKTAASLDGPFRIAPNGVTARADAATGESNYTLTLDVQWEPRFPVFRIDSQPRVTKATDDRGHALAVKTAFVKSGVAGYSHAADVRIDGLTRAAKTLATFDGEFTVTAAPKMLAFEFADLTTLPVSKELDGVKATLAKIVKRDEVWELQLTVEYPADPPSFESFESWTNRNALRLIAPKGRPVGESDNQDVVAVGRSVRAAYRYAFKAADLSARDGWKVVCETPAPLVEFPVRFQLKDIPLP